MKYEVELLLVNPKYIVEADNKEDAYQKAVNKLYEEGCSADFIIEDEILEVDE